MNSNDESIGQLKKVGLIPIPVLEDVPEVFALTVHVVKVAQADEREIIKAMAEASACGSCCCEH